MRLAHYKRELDMERPITHQFKTATFKIDITGRIPDWCTYRIPYAKAEQIGINEGTLVCQFHSHVLFFMEVIEIDLHTELLASYMVKNTSLFLVLMVEGEMSILWPDGKSIDAPEGVCYATYKKGGEYVFRLPKGKYCLCYLCPRPMWILKNLERYPLLKPFMSRMENNDELFGHMSPCEIDSGMKKNFKQLFQNRETEGLDLESMLSADAKKLIDEYQRLLDVKFSQREYQIRDYLDANFSNSALSNYSIAQEFHITEKTLIESFKSMFNTTPYHYLIQVRMKHAKQLLALDKMHVNQVYGKVGYRDLRSFSSQFKKTFKHTPLDLLKGHFLPFF